MQSFLQLLNNVVPSLLQGTAVTLQIAAVSLLLGMAIGLPVGIGRVYGPRWLQAILAAYITLFQGTPLLIQLFLVYYGLPDLGLTLGRMEAAFLTLGLNSAAYQAEYLRGALQSVGEGQMTAARAIGMSKWLAVRSIILPQALRLVLPAWSNEAIAMLKYTAVVFLIAVPDLMGQAKILSSRYFAPIPIYMIVAVFYIVLVGVAYLILRQLERRFHIPGLTGEAH
ncbi:MULTISPECIES: amino acid ABC transporter permease [Caldilinea]|jgi:polar amino acid transport system permease protein|uniref:Putative amino acid ABC transporter permease protein n=1 Tax=Caldilinea aerophila (strain DSM 14535 / JCM 11387 / NBRC 104270 / STL-6-O1) TaxID=926550 RepID=I0HZZ8_CALAS|nr:MULTISPECIES: amino acid ABC transporter permease [Caldilinea]BAL98585.1 putative amino acid ABC transporter permease protein [Caldilinea aerophila DSM 14535 = NBRC 104270]GIV74833.1 MAG: amino acid ABC transporter permease [Caldilinea sp.]